MVQVEDRRCGDPGWLSTSGDERGLDDFAMFVPRPRFAVSKQQVGLYL